MTQFLAVDLGASSGRTILGALQGGRLVQEELTRFPNNIIRVGGHWHWDLLALYNEIIRALRLVAQRGIEIESIGIDTWGVDVALFDANGMLLRAPYSYRDPHTNGEMERYFQKVPSRRVYDVTGIQFMNFNTVFQLSAMRREGDVALEVCSKILFIPDALGYMLTGQAVTERTILSTSGMMDAQTGRLSAELLAPMGLDETRFGRYVQPGEVIGTLTDEVMELTGLSKRIPVVAVAGHDTASAVAAIPAEGQNFAYLSSGTWSLMGIETRQAIINDESYKENFTNEGGIEGTTRFLKNICGMWLFECCKKEWTEVPTYDEIYAAVATVAPGRSVINPDDPRFAAPTSMVKEIQAACRETGQPVPETIAEQCRCIYDSLALRYKDVFALLRRMAPFPLDVLHVIGGGSLNPLLNQMIADTLGVPVLAGPQEATAAGNIMLQAKAAGAVRDIQEMRRLLAASFELRRFEPREAVK